MSDPQRPDDARLLEAWRAGGAAAPRPEGCLADDEIWRVARGEIEDEPVRRLLAHAVGCQACAASLALAGNLQREESAAAPAGQRRAAEGDRQSWPSRRGRAMLALGAAAALILLAGIPLAIMLMRRGATPESPPLDRLVAATLFKTGAAADEPLSRGSSVRPGDRLYLSLSAQVPVHTPPIMAPRRACA